MSLPRQCEVTPTGSGEVSRDEFVAHVWMLLRASEEQRQRFAFAKLDVNRSGALERSDLVASMRRQLSIARTLSSLLVQLQLRRHALTEPSPRPLRDLSETSRPLLQAHPHRGRAEAARRDCRRGRARDDRRDAQSGRHGAESFLLTPLDLQQQHAHTSVRSSRPSTSCSLRCRPALTAQSRSTPGNLG